MPIQWYLSITPIILTSIWSHMHTSWKPQEYTVTKTDSPWAVTEYCFVNMEFFEILTGDTDLV